MYISIYKSFKLQDETFYPINTWIVHTSYFLISQTWRSPPFFHRYRHFTSELINEKTFALKARTRKKNPITIYQSSCPPPQSIHFSPELTLCYLATNSIVSLTRKLARPVGRRMSTAYEMPAENRVSRFRCAICAAMRVNLVSATLQFRIRVAAQYAGFSWEKFAPCASVYGGGWFPWRTWPEKIETLISGYFPYPFFPSAERIICLLILATFGDRVSFFLYFLFYFWGYFFLLNFLKIEVFLNILDF